MFSWFKKKTPVKPTNAPVEMTADEINIIREYAGGAASRRKEALAIHYRYIPTIGVRGNVYQQFMAEDDRPVTDLGERYRLRQLVISNKKD